MAQWIAPVADMAQNFIDDAWRMVEENLGKWIHL